MSDLEEFLYYAVFYLLEIGLLLLYIAIIYYLFFGKRKQELLSHWNILIDGLNFSTEEAYNRVEQDLHNRGVSGLRIKRKNKRIGGWFSSRRTYLVIDWKEFRYEVCAAPFADSFFVSYWMHARQSWFKSFIARIPLLGNLISYLFFRVTYYRVDTSNMFHAIAQESITSMVDEISKAQNKPVLTDEQKTPKMKDIFQR